MSFPDDPKKIKHRVRMNAKRLRRLGEFSSFVWPAGNKFIPHNGKRECARRIHQGQAA